MSDSICICYLFEFKYFNYLKKKNKITYSKKKKKKNPLPLVKTIHSYPEISLGFFFLNSLKQPKFLLSKFYTIITNPHPSTLMYIIFLLFKSQILLLFTILILVNKFKCSIGYQFLTVFYLIFKCYYTLLYLI